MNDIESRPQKTSKGSSLAIPAAIVIAAALVAGAIFYTGNGGQAPNNIAGGGIDTDVNHQVTPEAPTIRPVDESDHIRGNPNAQILLVEYSDYDCPFCQRFHETMNQIINEYGTTGEVAWVYRHFPLEQLHPNAPLIAAASECVAELGGNDAFWTFSDLVFEERPQNDSTEIDRLPEFAGLSGVDEGEFQSCLESGRHDEKINESIQEAIAAGGEGTPHTLVIVGDQSGAINGAQPYEVVKQIVDNLLAQINGVESGS